MENRYGTLASWVYHLDKPIGRSFGDIEFYHDRLAGCSGPILEPAVGNGRMIVPLLEAGFRVEGFDASEEMLAFCRRECSARDLSPSLECRTFNDFQSETEFDAIIIPAGTFQLITNMNDAVSVLRKLYALLAPGGRLILDIDHMKGMLEPSGSIRKWHVSEHELLTLTGSPAEVDYAHQTSLTYLRYEHWRHGALVSTEIDLFHLRWWGIEELRLTLESVGFQEIVVSGGYEYGAPPTNDNGTFNFEARRP